jgi:anti-sigma factor RsiW
MPVDEERMIAWLDGELTGEEAAAVAAAVAADPELSALADAHRAVSARLRAGFAPLLAAPIPPKIVEALTSAATEAPANVTDLVAARAARTSRARPKLLPQWAAIAATLIIGLVAGRTSTGFGPEPMLVQGEAGLLASGQLVRALDAQLASAPPSGGVRVMVTFRALDGTICRSWATAGQEGIACRDGEGWRVAAVFSAPTEGQGDYRMAGGNNPQLLATLETMMDGDPFDRAQEQAARSRGWN